MQLLVNPLFEAHLTYAFDVAGTRPIREAIERMEGSLVLRQLGNGEVPLKFAVERRRRGSAGGLLIVLAGLSIRGGNCNQRRQQGG